MTVPHSVIDACAFHEWPSGPALVEYMDAGWRDLLVPPDAGFTVNTHGIQHISDPRLGPQNRFESTKGSLTQVPGSSYESFEGDVLQRDGRERVVLGYDVGLASTMFVHRYLARDVARAANDWTAAEWLSRDERLYGMILVSTAIPQEAAAEIRRAGQNDRMVAVALGCNGLDRMFGEPVYHPIFEAASEMCLPIVIQAGSGNAADQATPPIGGGVPTTYGEYRAHIGHSLWSHVASLVTEGVFNRWPNLRVLAVGGGAAWLPSWLWRMDYWWKIAGSAIPWVDRLPSEYLADHIRVSTQTLETAPQIAQALGMVSGIERVLMYTSCYPDPDWESPGSIAARLPAEWHDRVFLENAREFFRWPDHPVPTADDRAEVHQVV